MSAGIGFQRTSWVFPVGFSAVRGGNFDLAAIEAGLFAGSRALKGACYGTTHSAMAAGAFVLVYQVFRSAGHIGAPPAGASAAPADKPTSWRSARTFMSREVLPGLLSRGILEDDLTVQLCRELTWMLEVCGAKVVTLREVRDLGKEGVRRAGAGFEAWPKGADGQLPRLWEQTATYAIGAEHPDWLGSAEDPQTLRMVAGALANLCANAGLRDHLDAAGAVQALVQLASTASDPDVRAQVARGVANWVLKSDRVREFITDRGGLACLLAMAGSGSDIIAGMEWVADNAELPAVVNMSLGTLNGRSQAQEDAARGLYDAGILPVVAAGNDSTDACNTSPAAEPTAVTVGATDIDDGQASYSNFGSCHVNIKCWSRFR